MSIRNNEELKDKLLENEIKKTDTISQFMEKCNNNFTAIAEWGGGPEGVKGKKGEPGVPTKPKVPIHVWIKGEDYLDESSSLEGGYTIHGWNEKNLSDTKYQDGHLIMLENAHVYILEEDENDNFKLKPNFILALQSYNTNDIVNGRPGYVHIAYANSLDGVDFITDQELRENNNTTGNVSTFDITRDGSSNATDIGGRAYMGIYSDNYPISEDNWKMYTWMRILGEKGETGKQGEPGKKGDTGQPGEKGESFTGNPFSIDIEGDLSTISIGMDRKRLYDDDSCECKIHAYYGKSEHELNSNEITFKIPDGYTKDDIGNIYLGDEVVVGKEIGYITKGSDILIKEEVEFYFYEFDYPNALKFDELPKKYNAKKLNSLKEIEKIENLKIFCGSIYMLGKIFNN
jgi:hypothetical protein